MRRALTFLLLLGCGFCYANEPAEPPVGGPNPVPSIKWGKGVRLEGGVKPIMRSTYDIPTPSHFERDVVYRANPDLEKGRIYREPGSGLAVPGGRMNEDWGFGNDDATFINSFDGIYYTGWVPADPDVAVGNDWVVTVTNDAFKFYDKAGRESYLNWFSPFLADFSSGATEYKWFDPKVIFDPWNQRFVILVLGKHLWENHSRVTLMVSDDANPNGGWGVWFLNGESGSGTTEAWADYYDLGYSQDVVYAAGNQFQYGGDELFRTNTCFMWNKSELYNFQQLNYTRITGMEHSSGADLFAPRCAKMTVGHSADVMLVTSINGGGSTVTVTKYTNVFTNPTATRTTINVGGYAVAPVVLQPGNHELMDFGCRLMNAYLTYEGGYRLFSGLMTKVRPSGDTADRMGARLMVLNPDSSTPVDEITFVSSNYYYMFPSVACDMKANAVWSIGRTGTAAGQFPSMRYATYTNLGGFDTSSVLAMAGENWCNQGRWGDYFGGSPDWGDWNSGTGYQRIWVTGKWQQSNNTHWATHIVATIAQGAAGVMTVSGSDADYKYLVRGANNVTTNFVVGNAGTVGYRLRVTCNKNWVSLSGTLDQEVYGNEDNVVIGATINSNANTLPYGLHVATVKFENLTTGAQALKTITLALGDYFDPTSYTINRGSHFDGDITDVLSSNNQYLSAFNNPTGLDTAITIRTELPVALASEVNYFQESAILRPGMSLETAIYNWDTATWNIRNGRTAPQTDTSFWVTIRAPGYISSGGTASAKMTWQQINDEDPATDGWLSRIDRARFLIYP